MLESNIKALLKPITDELGLDILKVSIGGGARQQLLKVVVDQAGGIQADALARVSRGLALQLDAEDLFKLAYQLEVTSPGLDWPLTTVADFERYKGDWIKVLLLEGTSWEGRNMGPLPCTDEKGLEDVRFTLSIETKKAKNNRQEVICMAEVQKVVRSINWAEVSRNS